MVGTCFISSVFRENNMPLRFLVSSVLVLITFFAGHGNISGVLASESADQSALAGKTYAGESFKAVLEDISSLSGYRISVPEDLLTIPVYGQFRPENVDLFLARILKNYNHSLRVNTIEKIVVVRVMGKKVGDNIILAGAPGKLQIDPFTGLTKEEIEYIQEEHRYMISEPGYVDPFTGLTVAQLEAMQNEQQQRKLDPDAIDAFTGLKLKEVNDLQEKNRIERNKPGAVDSFTGLQLSEIKEMQARATKRRMDPEYVDPFTGMTVAEIKDLRNSSIKK
jgi:hypothetical protein